MSDPRAGFTLVEALAALTVLAVGLVLVQQIYRNSIRTDHAAEQMNAALWLADRHMAIGVASPLAPGIETGEGANGFRWRRHTYLADPSDGQMRGIWVIEVEVSAPQLSRKTRLVTMRLGPSSEAVR
ncbi:MAG: prepilin-type N-terminal cleavage/methylation domain-containing protein [Pseudomonadota bacterium]